MLRVLLVDNYDSFTFNLCHFLEGEGAEVDVVRNDELFSVDVENYDGIVFSPGPGLPEDAGSMMKFMKINQAKKPMLGVCLGMQAMAILLGGELKNQQLVKHGVATTINFERGKLFEGISSPAKVGLYHSWAVTDTGNYEITAVSEDGIIMAIENNDLHLYGVQFHPESIITLKGREMIANFLRLL